MKLSASEGGGGNVQKYTSSESYCDCSPYERRNLSSLDSLAKNTQRRRRIIISLSKHQPNIIIIIRCRFAGKTLAGYCSDLQFVVPFVSVRWCLYYLNLPPTHICCNDFIVFSCWGSSGQHILMLRVFLQHGQWLFRVKSTMWFNFLFLNQSRKRTHWFILAAL